MIPEQKLVSLKKPAQYLGGELNSITKADVDVEVNFALAFPDLYEVGMSHVGIQILYQIINQDPTSWAERVYMPMDDMEAFLRESGNKLTSLESDRPLHEFDILGFSLQYELCATNILCMLELGGIQFYSKERNENHPLVIGGGPYSYHPEAISPFFDAFFLGDAEEAIPEMLEAVKVKKREGLTRSELLKRLSEIEGVYVPSLYEHVFDEDNNLVEVKSRENAPKQVVRRLLPTMEGAPYVSKPIVPNIDTVHNRLSLEVMRGCVRGCRFCQAGYLYRPQRERSPEEILKMVGESLPETGYEELSLLSLSTADYCSIVPLLKSLMDSYAKDDKLAVSFPSTRVDSLKPDVLEQVQRVRRTGFTIAPEGGTQRIRDVINKGVSDEQILETVSNVFKMGWTGIKMYFMLGLPTETDEDLKGIIDIAKRVKALPEAKGKAITVSVSTHVPKPHTPFQWSEQITPEETVRKQRLLAAGLKKVGVNFRYHDAFSSFLEGVFCRAGCELAPVVERAYQLGSRLEAWNEHLSEEIWMQAFMDCNIDPYFYLQEKEVDQALPWDHLSCGIPKSYFAKEWRRALRDKSTPDCLTASCSVCKACDYDAQRNILWPREDSEAQLPQLIDQHKISNSDSEAKVYRYRFEYKKFASFRMLGHLEFSKVVHRTFRRAGIAVDYSKGFHPMPRISFGPPLQLGVSSQVEFFDAFLLQKKPAEEIRKKLNENLPEGINIVRIQEVALKEKSLQEQIVAYSFETEFLAEPKSHLAELPRTGSNDLLPYVADIKITRQKRSKRRGRIKESHFDLQEFLEKAEYSFGDGDAAQLKFRLKRTSNHASPKPTEVVEALSGLSIGEYKLNKTQTHFE